METLHRFIVAPSPCGYLPGERWRLEYELVADATAAEYLQRMLRGWRRFGATFFRPDRSQRRCRKANEGVVRLQIGVPSVTRAKLRLYDLYHAHQAEAKGWPQHPAKDAASYAASFADNPFPTQEWCYYVGDRLVGVGYVDDLPGALSAIYFFYDPDERHRSLGTWNVLQLLEQARARRLAYVYLGYYVAGCPSMAYKTRFVPNQLLAEDGHWHDFRT
jgi:leucyl-tRNA---protein transferase